MINTFENKVNQGLSIKWPGGLGSHCVRTTILVNFPQVGECTYVVSSGGGLWLSHNISLMKAARDLWKSYLEAGSHFRVSRDRVCLDILSWGGARLIEVISAFFILSDFLTGSLLLLLAVYFENEKQSIGGKGLLYVCFRGRKCGINIYNAWQLIFCVIYLHLRGEMG